MPIIVENVSVHYRRQPALARVNVCFGEGEAWAVCGPNGAGKSTLLKTVMGLARCDTGRIRWEGLGNGDIAYLPQLSEIDRSQPVSVFELAAMGLWHEIGFWGGANALQRDRVRIALQRVGMADADGRLIAELSNGQFQRVLWARMLVQNAKFLLLDEPFNAIDAHTTAALLTILENCLHHGQAVIAVLHDEGQIRTHFSRCLLLAQTQIAVGDTAAVLCADNRARATAWQMRAETAGGDE